MARWALRWPLAALCVLGVTAWPGPPPKKDANDHHAPHAPPPKKHGGPPPPPKKHGGPPPGPLPPPKKSDERTGEARPPDVDLLGGPPEDPPHDGLLAQESWGDLLKGLAPPKPKPKPDKDEHGKEKTKVIVVPDPRHDHRLIHMLGHAAVKKLTKVAAAKIVEQLNIQMQVRGAWCGFHISQATEFLTRASIQIGLATQACVPSRGINALKMRNFKDFVEKLTSPCTADISAIIGSFLWVAGYISLVASECSKFASLDTMCAGLALSLTGALSEVAAAGIVMEGMCYLPPRVQARWKDSVSPIRRLGNASSEAREDKLNPEVAMTAFDYGMMIEKEFPEIDHNITRPEMPTLEEMQELKQHLLDLYANATAADKSTGSRRLATDDGAAGRPGARTPPQESTPGSPADSVKAAEDIFQTAEQKSIFRDILAAAEDKHPGMLEEKGGPGGLARHLADAAGMTSPAPNTPYGAWSKSLETYDSKEGLSPTEQNLEKALCVVDSFQAASFLGIFALAFDQTIMACAVHTVVGSDVPLVSRTMRSFCTAEVSYVLFGLFSSISFIASAVSHCGNFLGVRMSSMCLASITRVIAGASGLPLLGAGLDLLCPSTKGSLHHYGPIAATGLATASALGRRLGGGVGTALGANGTEGGMAPPVDEDEDEETLVV